jgi:GGDEF domain-containing protein
MWLANDSLLRERNVTGSFGVASFPMHGATIEEIVHQADQAMYCSKTAGGNRVSTPAAASEAVRETQEERVGI